MDDNTPHWWQWIVRTSFDWRFQIVFAALVGIAGGYVFEAVPDGLLNQAPEFQSYLLGLGAMLALVATLIFGFFLNYLQQVSDERHLHYARFKENVEDLREYLDRLCDERLIEEEYDFAIGSIEELTLKDFPAFYFGERLAPLTECVITDNQAELEYEGNSDACFAATPTESMTSRRVLNHCS